jgi:hypothetical protein
VPIRTRARRIGVIQQVGRDPGKYQPGRDDESVTEVDADDKGQNGNPKQEPAPLGPASPGLPLGNGWAMVGCPRPLTWPLVAQSVRRRPY